MNVFYRFSTVRSMIVLSFFLALELFNSISYAQENREANELKERRGYFEKHFQRPDGKVDMLISSDPINFLENNKWKTISNAIVEKTAILTTLKRSILTSYFHLPKRTI